MCVFIQSIDLKLVSPDGLAGVNITDHPLPRPLTHCSCGRNPHGEFEAMLIGIHHYNRERRWGNGPGALVSASLPGLEAYVGWRISDDVRPRRVVDDPESW